MTDHSELKRLAEAATQGEWGFSGSYIAPLRREQDGSAYVEIWRSIAQANNPDNAKFIAKANPASVLALIAEVEQLNAENKRLSALLECSQGDMLTADKIIAERDRLLSMFDCPDHGQCVPYAMGQVEALRKDAQRYRWLRAGEFDIGSYHPEGDHNHESWFEHFDDDSIDSGIADEAELEARAAGKGGKS